uniref:Uncharacterized protein n=1 Tax=uncultured marine virus TaxID=186617 RepID=A0A0F7L7V1_9VIRU|nr:hypothetical protein [uncultured marine virus]
MLTRSSMENPSLRPWSVLNAAAVLPLSMRRVDRRRRSRMISPADSMVPVCEGFQTPPSAPE